MSPIRLKLKVTRVNPGPHIWCQVFADDGGGTYGLCGQLCFRWQEFERFSSLGPWDDVEIPPEVEKKLLKAREEFKA